MSKIVQMGLYQRIAYTDLNNISKFVYETILKDIATYCFSRSQAAIISLSGNPVLQNTGSDYNVKVEQCLVVKSDGTILINPAEQIINIPTPASSARIDILEVTFKYTDQNQLSRQFVDPASGEVTVALTYTEFLIDMLITRKAGSEGAGVAPTADAGYAKICEIYVPLVGGIANANIYNVTSQYGEANTGWTAETTATILLKTINDHRNASTLDHPNNSVTVDKLVATGTVKSSIVAADRILIGDSANSQKGAYVLLSTLLGIVDILSAKSSLATTDEFLINDSAASFVAKKITVPTLFGGLDALTLKASPILADEIALSDSASSFTGKKTTLADAFGIFSNYIDGLNVTNTTTNITVKGGLKIVASGVLYSFPSDTTFTNVVSLLSISYFNYVGIGIKESDGTMGIFLLKNCTLISGSGWSEANNQLNLGAAYSNTYGYVRDTYGGNIYRIFYVAKVINGFTDGTTSSTSGYYLITCGDSTKYSIGMSLSGTNYAANTQVVEIVDATHFAVNVPVTGSPTSTVIAADIQTQTQIYKRPQTLIRIHSGYQLALGSNYGVLNYENIDIDLLSEISGAYNARLYTALYTRTVKSFSRLNIYVSNSTNTYNTFGTIVRNSKIFALVDSAQGIANAQLEGSRTSEFSLGAAETLQYQYKTSNSTGAYHANYGANTKGALTTVYFPRGIEWTIESIIEK